MLQRLLIILLFSICPILGYNSNLIRDNMHYPFCGLFGFVVGKKIPPRDDLLAKLMIVGCAGYNALCSLDNVYMLYESEEVEDAIISSSCKCVFWALFVVGGLYDMHSTFLHFQKVQKKWKKLKREQREIAAFIGPRR